MQSNRHSEIRNEATTMAASAVANTDLYDLWLNSMLPTVGPSMVTGVTSSSSHQFDVDIDSERLAEKLIQIGCDQRNRTTAEDRR